jgi:hypothetical protein
MKIRTLCLLIFLVGCHSTSAPPPTTSSSSEPVVATATAGTAVKLTNQQGPLTVYFNFGADSAITPADWSFCTATGPLNCNFTLTGSKELPTSGKYLNVTIAFGHPVTCDMTKAELNVNNPKWYDIYDVSLVDGYSNKIEIDYKAPDGTTKKIGPPNGKTDNEKVFGVYPYGCDICVARKDPQCGISKGTEGCKKGSQYNPDVPCQFQGPVKSGGGEVNVALLP